MHTHTMEGGCVGQYMGNMEEGKWHYCDNSVLWPLLHSCAHNDLTYVCIYENMCSAGLFSNHLILRI